MRATFESDDPMEINRIAKSLNMALFIDSVLSFDWSEYDNDSGVNQISEKLLSLAYNYNIYIEDLVE